MGDHVTISLLCSVYACFGALNRQRKCIHDDKSPIQDLALKEAHDFIDAAGPGVDDLPSEGSWRARASSAEAQASAEANSA